MGAGVGTGMGADNPGATGLFFSDFIFYFLFFIITPESSHISSRIFPSEGTRGERLVMLIANLKALC